MRIFISAHSSHVAHIAHMFKILSRYIFLSVAGSAAIAMLFIGFIFGAANLLRDVLGYMLDGRLPVRMFLQLCWWTAEYVAMYAVPIGLLLGVLLVFGRLSAENEITAMRTSGLSIRQIARPVFVLAILGAIVALDINFYLMPKARTDYHVKLEEALRDAARNFLIPKTFIRDLPDTVIFFDSKTDSDEGPLYHNVWVWRLDKERRAREIFHAASATIEFDVASDSMIVFPTINTTEVRDGDDPEKPIQGGAIPKYEGAQKYAIPLGALLGKRGVNRKIEWFTLPELLAEKQRLAAARADAVEQLRVSYTIQEKLTFSLAAFSFVFMAIPLGIRAQRKESSVNFLLAVLVVVTYYIMSTAIGWLDHRPDLHPEILIWLPNIVFIAAGVWLLQRVERAR